MNCASQIPSYTGLGNKLFCIASGIGIAKSIGRKYIIDWNLFDLSNSHSNLNYDYFYRGIPRDSIKYPAYSFPKEAPNTIKYQFPNDIPKDGDVIITGWRQSEKYFSNVSDQVRSLFSAPPDKDYSIINPGSAFIHVRRGDYLICNNVDLTNYYLRSRATFTNINQWYVFSDDIAWCKEQKIFAGSFFIEGYNEIDSLWMMSKCEKGGICANSSYSWWGSWLNPNTSKRITMPKRWLTCLDTSLDIYYSGVDVIDC